MKTKFTLSEQEKFLKEAREIREGDVQGEYMSHAEWPKGTFPHCHDHTTDTHGNNKDGAEGACSLLHEHGAGGNGRVFPIRTWVTYEVTAR